MQKKARILFARITYGGEERSELGTWTALSASWMATSPLVDEVYHVAIDACPTPTARHQVIELARKSACDLIFSVDGDTIPDRQWVPFAVPWLLGQKVEAVLCAPYCCAPPKELVQVFRWATEETDGPNDLGRFENYGREEAALKTGLEQVACAGTGCFACHTSVFDKIDPPYFDYEYENEFRSKVICTEDINCFRDLTVAGVPIVVSWDHWAQHAKIKFVGRPAIMSTEQVWTRTQRQLALRAAKEQAAMTPAGKTKKRGK